MKLTLRSQWGQIVSTVGIFALLVLPGSLIQVNNDPGGEGFYVAAAGALPALLIAVALGFWAVLRFFDAAYGTGRRPVPIFRVVLVHLEVWAVLIGSGACFTGLTECSHQVCSTPGILDRVQLGLGAAYLLVAETVLAAFAGVLRGRASIGD